MRGFFASLRMTSKSKSRGKDKIQGFLGYALRASLGMTFGVGLDSGGWVKEFFGVGGDLL